MDTHSQTHASGCGESEWRGEEGRTPCCGGSPTVDDVAQQPLGGHDATSGVASATERLQGVAPQPAVSEEKKAAWEADQHRLAQLAAVPRMEIYSDLATGCEGTAPDDTFVHRWFALPDLEAALTSSSRVDAGECSGKDDHDSAAARRSATPNATWEALVRQLRFDKAQQSSAVAAAPPLPALVYVGGIDISFVRGTSDGVACLTILRYPSMELVGTYMHRCALREPYLSGFLAFREVQPVCELWESVRAELLVTQTLPQLLLVDGNGVQHPRRCGLATHLGVVLGIPTIGCTKKLLQVDGLTRETVEAALDATTVSPAAHSPTPHLVPLLGATPPRQLYGYAIHGVHNSVRKCIYVSPGHCIGYAAATALVLTMLRHRIPEPIRAADLSSRAYIRDAAASAD
ncbi:endonuclease V [Novymonas esmeraldas]|uniref:Endonuclease V n=1 Tax=Novymonas esmeraldas TaxID=1808958 RepID=A0AAW0F407_9TRYP